MTNSHVCGISSTIIFDRSTNAVNSSFVFGGGEVRKNSFSSEADVLGTWVV